MSKNYSEAYGGYGGVSNNAHYVPPPIPDFVPQPPSVPFTTTLIDEIQKALRTINLNDLTTFINTNSGNLLLRKEIIDSDLSTDVFSMFTMNNPTEQITFTVPASSDTINMFNLDGGTF